MIIRRTFDRNEIDSVIKHPAIWSRIAPKGLDPDSFDTPLDPSIYYVVGEREGVVIGLMIYKLIGSDLETHVQVLPDFRKHADNFARGALSWAEKFIQFEKFIASIPNIYPDVIGFGRKHGFVIVRDENEVTYMERENGLRS